MATKKDLAVAVEKLAEEIAVAHGATIEIKAIKVGGRLTDSRVAVGGLFDLDACRGILAKALQAKRTELVSFFAATQPGAVKAAYDLQNDALTPTRPAAPVAPVAPAANGVPAVA